MTDAPYAVLDRAGLDRARAVALVADALSGADDGELYLEHAVSEGLVFDNGRLKSASFDTTQGFGLRAVAGEASGYAHSGEISEPAIRRAAEAGHIGVEFAAVLPRGAPGGDAGLHHAKADVVARVGILAARVTQADDQPNRRSQRTRARDA